VKATPNATVDAFWNGSVFTTNDLIQTKPALNSVGASLPSPEKPQIADIMVVPAHFLLLGM
jgi:hypothetical protein